MYKKRGRKKKLNIFDTRERMLFTRAGLTPPPDETPPNTQSTMTSERASEGEREREKREREREERERERELHLRMKLKIYFYLTATSC